MSELQKTIRWFEQAVPNPTVKNFNVQLGCHLEEVKEMLDAVQGLDGGSAVALTLCKQHLHELAEAMKKGTMTFMVQDRKEFLDGGCDQLVTATGVLYMVGMNADAGLGRVNTSNYSKFVDGEPRFDANGKIAKPPTFQKPDFTGLY